MTEQRFLHSQRSSAPPPVSLRPNRIGIPIHWSEGAVMSIIIRHPLQTATEEFCLNLTPGCCQEYQALLMLHLQPEGFLPPRRKGA